VQGKITTWDGSRIGNCGFYFDSMYRCYPRYEGLPVTQGNKEATISFVTGCYSVFRVEALEKCGGLFGNIVGFFAYFEDANICLRIWRKGYKIKYVPVMAGQHKGNASFSEFQLLIKYYLSTRNRLSSIINLDRSGRLPLIQWVIYLISGISIFLGLSVFRNKNYKTKAKYIARALIDSFSLAKRTPKIKGDALEPYVKFRFSSMLKDFFRYSDMTAR
jgi:GT2 family glycosyltransferase